MALLLWFYDFGRIHPSQEQCRGPRGYKRLWNQRVVEEMESGGRRFVGPGARQMTKSLSAGEVVPSLERGRKGYAGGGAACGLRRKHAVLAAGDCSARALDDRRIQPGVARAAALDRSGERR